MEAATNGNQKIATTHSKIKDLINGKTPLREAYESAKAMRTWAPNTLKSYDTTITYLTDFMVDHDIHPIIDNIDFELLQHWTKYLLETKKEKSNTIKQRIAAMSSIFSFFKELGVLAANPFITIRIKKTDVGHHSRVLSFEEVFHIYSILKSEQDLLEIELPILLDLFTGFRNVTLCKLTADMITNVENGIQYGEIEEGEGEEDGSESTKELNTTKYKKGFMPLPPLLLQKLNQYVDDLGLDGKDSLLYGVRGNPLANKQLNHMVKKLCDSLKWKDKKEITPYAFRYTFATMLGEMGVTDDAIRYALGHSIEISKGSLSRYVQLTHRYQKEIRIAQTILEEVLETLFMLQEHHLLNVNIKQIFQEMQDLYPLALKNDQHITRFKYSIIELANKNKQMELMNLKGQSPMQQGAPQQLIQGYQQPNPFMATQGVQAANPFSNQQDPNMMAAMMQQLYQMMQMNMNQQQGVFQTGGQFNSASANHPYMQQYSPFPPVS